MNLEQTIERRLKVLTEHMLGQMLTARTRPQVLDLSLDIFLLLSKPFFSEVVP